MQPNKGTGLPLKRPDSKGKDEPAKRMSSTANVEKKNVLSAKSTGKDAPTSEENLKDLLITNVMSGLSILDSHNKKPPSSQDLKFQEKSNANSQEAKDAFKVGGDQKSHTRSDSLTRKFVKKASGEISAKETFAPSEKDQGTEASLKAAREEKPKDDSKKEQPSEARSQLKMESNEEDFDRFLPSTSQKKDDENEVRSILAFEKQRIYMQRRYKVGESKVLSVRIDENRNFIATGSEDGQVRIYQIKRDEPVFSLNEEFKIKSPVTQVRWRPNDESVNGMKNVLITALTNGILYYWHVTTSKQMKQIEERNNEIYAVDVSTTGLKLASAGRDGQVRIYDEGKFKQVVTLKPGKTPGHTNRIYAAKFAPDDPNVLLTAGWDEMVLVWDLRSGASEKFIYGPLVCGDALDVKENIILTGSWRDNKQIQLWDLRTGLNRKNVPWDEFNADKKSFIYSAQFSKSMDEYVLAGSTGNFELRMFEKRLGYKCVDAFRELDQGIYTMDISKDENLCVFGGGGGMCCCVEIL